MLGTVTRVMSRLVVDIPPPSHRVVCEIDPKCHASLQQARPPEHLIHQRQVR